MDYDKLLQKLSKMESGPFAKSFIKRYICFHKTKNLKFKYYELPVTEFSDESISRALGEEFDLFWPILEKIKMEPISTINTISSIIKMTDELGLDELHEFACMMLARCSHDISPKSVISALNSEN